MAESSPASLRLGTRSPEEGAAVVERFRALREDIRATGGPITREEIRAWIRDGQR